MVFVAHGGAATGTGYLMKLELGDIFSFGKAGSSKWVVFTYPTECIKSTAELTDEVCWVEWIIRQNQLIIVLLLVMERVRRHDSFTKKK
jgi:hypothetical protein